MAGNLPHVIGTMIGSGSSLGGAFRVERIAIAGS
jgi:hypothetical protein